MSDLRVVYDSPNKCDYLFIKNYLKRKIPVWVIEPFHAYHHKKGLRFFPPHLPSYIENLINSGEISILKAKDIHAEEIYLHAADKAVGNIGDVYPAYRKRFGKIFKYVSDTLKSPIAENVFKITLCNKLAEFYSVNILLHRIDKHFNALEIVAYPDTNVYSYLFIRKLLMESNLEFFEHPNIRFQIKAYVNSFLDDLRLNLFSMAKLGAQTFVSGFCGKVPSSAANKKKVFFYGVSILGVRQLRRNNRGPDFIIDNKTILASEVVYFPFIKLTKDQEKFIDILPGGVHHLPIAGRFFSNFPQWKGLLYLGVKQKLLRNSEELMAASIAFLNYFRWQKVMGDLSIRHFITHADFGAGHIGRNLALNQADVQTWYFTDSMNQAGNFLPEEKHGARHPFWAYLGYDHLVTWADSLGQYYQDHPGSFKQTHVVGCLWSEHIQEKSLARKETKVPAFKNLGHRYVIACFDSTYSINGLTSYAEGLSFAKHLMGLGDECPDMHIIFKEKKDRNIHHTLDPILGPELIEMYNKMDLHPRIKICSNDVNASELISVSDIVVSFPFTSTTFETLSINRPAIWHDPMGYYRDTFYGKVGNVVTHNYHELKSKILEIKNLPHGSYKTSIPMTSSLMDPYRDGKAIDRFRNLLTSEQ